jgi:catechol-2,3-dioxygenase
MSANGTANGGKVISPSKLAHVVLTTAPEQMQRMKTFYVRFLGGSLVYENDYLCFITYDDEHHRIALAAFPGTKPKDHSTSGLAHVAFTFNNLHELCTSYKQRKALGMEPGWCVVSNPCSAAPQNSSSGN